MDRSSVFRWVRRGALIVGAAVIAFLIAAGRGFSLEQPLQLNARYLSDGLFAVGFLLTGMGALVWVSTTGFFDIMTYGVKSLLVLFTPLKKASEHPSYYDYKMERESRRGRPSYAMLAVGLVFLALSIACLGIYYA